MPALFALGVRAVLRSMQADLLPNESVLVFLDDTYITSQPLQVWLHFGGALSCQNHGLTAWFKDWRQIFLHFLCRN